MGLLKDLFTMAKISTKLAVRAKELSKDLESNDVEKIGEAFFKYLNYAVKLINDADMSEEVKKNMLKGMVETLREKIKEAGRTEEDVEKIISQIPELKKFLK